MNELLIRKAGKNLLNLEDWFQICPPPAEPEDPWSPGHPSWENARSFFRTAEGPGTLVPPDLQGILKEVPLLGLVRLESVVPEFLVKTDGTAGSSCRLHALGTGLCREGRVAVAVHARTEAGFGPLIRDQARRSRPGSLWTRRLEQLAAALTGRGLEECGGLRAGLLPLAAAALRAAEEARAATAVLIFRQFRPHPPVHPQQLKEQNDDLDRFSTALGGSPLKCGVLCGPLVVPGGGGVPATVPFFLGRTLTVIR